MFSLSKTYDPATITSAPAFTHSTIVFSLIPPSTSISKLYPSLFLISDKF